MKRLVAALLVLCACGGGQTPSVEATFALSQDLIDRVQRVQIAFVAGSADCGRLQSKCLTDQGRATEPVESGASVQVVDFAPVSGAQDVDAQVAAGTYAVLVEAMDVSGKLVANACKLNVALKSGETTQVRFDLVAFTGASCDARMK